RGETRCVYATAREGLGRRQRLNICVSQRNTIPGAHPRKTPRPTESRLKTGPPFSAA
ncbi:hypothetical protein chiPu_0022385, partial [Chiloscyllium punctatum]|nr:hypothetical protein [Chiloscyllium punctatum]